MLPSSSTIDRQVVKLAVENSYAYRLSQSQLVLYFNSDDEFSSFLSKIT
jgi:hypothetical protein